MKKERLSTEDGSEFTVFYLDQKTKSEPSGPNNFTGWLGTQELSSYDEDRYDEPEVLIDDTIQSDYVQDPVRGRLYKAKGLGLIARFKDWYDESYLVLAHHKGEFLVETSALLKASELEVEIYLKKSLD
jgi:hypothetical protein